MVAVGPNFFYTVTLSVTLWFLDGGKADTKRADTVLFIDARGIFRQVDRAHREFTDEQIEFLANVVRLYRGEDPELATGSNQLFSDRFPDSAYADVNGLCRVASIAEIAEQGFSLNPGRYVGTGVLKGVGVKAALDDVAVDADLGVLIALTQGVAGAPPGRTTITARQHRMRGRVFSR